MKKTLKQMIDESLDPVTAQKMAPILKKYADRAAQDKSPDAQVLNQLVAELINTSKQQPAQTQQTNTTAQGTTQQ